MQVFFDDLLGAPGATDIIAQVFGILGMAIMILSFQCRSNKLFFIMQGSGALMFIINFLLIGAFGSAFLNVVAFTRGILFMKNDRKRWRFILTIMLSVAAFALSAILDHSTKQLILNTLTSSAMIAITLFMWQGDPRRIRTAQICFNSPAWLVNNFFNFSLGGIICETFNMVSSLIFLLRTRKNTNNNKEIGKSTASPS